jgi:hypothetical protein
MAVSVLLDAYALPHKGPVDLSIKRKFTINITAEEAQQLVHGWLVDELSCNIGAEAPTLVIGEQPVWRVPAYLSFPRFGRVGMVGAVDVDVETGVIHNQLPHKIALEQAANELAQRLPPYQPRQVMPKEFLSRNIPVASKLCLTEDDLLPEENQEETFILEVVN